MERLGHIITQAVDDGIWKPIKLSKYGPTLSHLFLFLIFFYDLLLFVEASIDYIEIMMSGQGAAHFPSVHHANHFSAQAPMQYY